MSTYSCVCGKKFDQHYLLSRHLNGKNNYCNMDIKDMLVDGVQDDDNTCHYCNKKFANKFSKERHLNKCTKKDITSNTTSLQLDHNEKDIFNTMLKLFLEDKTQAKLFLEDKATEIKKYKNALSQSNNKIIILANELAKQSNKKLEDIISIYSLENYFCKNENKEYNVYENLNNLNNLNNFNISRNFSDKDGCLGINDKIRVTFDNNLEPIINIEPDIDASTQLQSSNIIKSNNSEIINTGTNICNNSNSTIINNNINITQNFTEHTPYIYPFGYENISFLNNREMLDILKSKNGSEYVIEKIYSHLPNQNFINPNKKNMMIAVIEKDLRVRFYRLEAFAKKLFENSIFLLMRIYHRCQNKLSAENKMIVLSNIRRIEEQLLGRTELYEQFETIIMSISNNSVVRKNFATVKIKLEQKDLEVIDKVKECIKTEMENIEKYQDDLAKKNLTREYIYENIWQPEEDFLEMDLDTSENNLFRHRVTETLRYQKRKELENIEMELIKSKGSLIGDIETLLNLRLQRDLEECKLLKEYYNIPQCDKDEIDSLFNESLCNIENLQSVRFMKEKQILHI